MLAPPIHHSIRHVVNSNNKKSIALGATATHKWWHNLFAYDEYGGMETTTTTTTTTTFFSNLCNTLYKTSGRRSCVLDNIQECHNSTRSFDDDNVGCGEIYSRMVVETSQGTKR